MENQILHSDTLPFVGSPNDRIAFVPGGGFFMEEEIWKDIPGFEGIYRASNLGRIMSVSRIKYVNTPKKPKLSENIILKQCITSKARYLAVLLWKNDKGHSKRVHILIAKTFIPNPLNKPEVNHKDLNKFNNRVDNLEWMTRSENIKHSFDAGARELTREKARERMRIIGKYGYLKKI